jgi:hypothetical protein
LKPIVILNFESIEWPKPRQTIFLFGLCECEIENYCKLTKFQVIETKIKNGID